MHRPRSRLVLALLLAACGGDPEPPRPPRADFLVVAGDSTFWVRSGDQARVRGSPLQLARYGGRFYELYPTDDDHSYYEAVMVGQRLWRRDLLGGDSAVVFEDTTIAALARWYADEHPRERPLTPDEDASAEPRIDVAGELTILEQLGPWLSYEYRVDGTMIGGGDWGALRRGVVDLRTGRAATVADLAGAEAPRIVARGRALLSAAIDSVLASRDERAREAARSLGALTFDPASFSVVAARGAPAIEFAAVGAWEDAGTIALALEPIPFAPPAWWREAAGTLPDTAGDATVARWPRGRLAVEAEPDSADPERLRLSLVDSAARRWPLALVPGPARRLWWLDGGAADSATRRALERAFDEAALYSEETRVAAAPRRREPAAARPAAVRRAPAARSRRAGSTIRS